MIAKRRILLATLTLLFFSFFPGKIFALGDLPCLDSDNSLPNQSGEDRHLQGTTRGYSHGRYVVRQDHCDSDRTGLEYACRDNRNISSRGFRCQEGETCENGACTIVVDRCGDIEWRDGATYVLNRDLACVPTSTIFSLRRQNNITFDCQGHNISLDPNFPPQFQNGFFSIYQSSYVTIKNCNINSIDPSAIGIVISDSTFSVIQNNNLVNLSRGIELWSGNNNRIINNNLNNVFYALSFVPYQSNDNRYPIGSNTVSNNAICDHNRQHTAFACWPNNHNNSFPSSYITGEGNSTLIQNMADDRVRFELCPDEWLDTFYQECP